MPRLPQKPVLFVFCTCLLLLEGCSASGPAGGTMTDPETRPTSSFSPFPDLKAAIDGLLPDSLFPPSNIGMMVVALARGQTLYELNPDLMFTPASNQKLFTSAAALSVLGPDFGFLTDVSVDTMEVPTICVRGSGDPLLSTGDLDSLASLVGTLLPREREWLLAGDVSLFDDVPWGPGWMWDDEAEPDGMAITPLSVNGNTVRVRVRAGSTPGDTLVWMLEPQTGFVTIENKGLTTLDTAGLPLRITRRLHEQSNAVVITGTLRPGDTSSARVAVHGPAWYMLRVFSERLEKHGIRCAGMVLDTVPPTARQVCSFYHRLDTVVTHMNRMSDNLSAECLLKTLGAARMGAPGTTHAGLEAVKGFLSDRGLDTTQITLADGSGVSRYNLATARGIAGLLQVMHRDQKLFPLFFNSLPAPGERGSLSGRMRGTTAEHHLRAKTGTLRGVSSISGYLSAANGELLAFSVIMQNFPGSVRSYRQVQDRICVLLSQWGENE